MNMDGQIALVTGATKGIGLAIAADLAQAGAKVLMNYRRDAEQAKHALESVREISPDAELMQADIADPSDVDRMFRQIRTDYGRLDGFVNNAGVTADGFAVMMGEAKWRKVIDTNLTGAFFCMRAAGRLMASQKSGAIVAVASTSGISAPAGQANYAASKAGVAAFTKSLAKELAGKGITVNAVAPGFIETEMVSNIPDKVKNKLLEQIPLKRFGTAEEVARAVVYIVSSDGDYITGAELSINGGLLM
jgi:3-oxoacyl-[acyl-carrier protein] reductase